VFDPQVVHFVNVNKHTIIMKHLIALFVFLWFGFSGLAIVSANTLVPATGNPSSPQTSEDACTLEPPLALFVFQVGTSWIDYAWPTVLNATQYHLITYEVSSGNVLDDRYVNANMGLNTQSARVTNLPQTTVYTKIWSVCQNGEQGSNSTTGPNTEILIIDFIVSGYPTQPSINSWTDACTVNLGEKGGCNFSSHPGVFTYFRIKHESDPLIRLHFTMDVSGAVGELRPDANDPDYGPQKFNFVDLSSHVDVNFGNLDVARLTVKKVSPAEFTLFREGTGNNMNYVITRLAPPPFGMMDPNNDNGENPLPEKGFLTASPNPFQNSLDIRMPVTNDVEDMTISLYDLQGRLVMQRTTPADTQIRIFGLEDIKPGMYVLRVDTGSKSEMIKVIKTQ
jgi:hypothetical protein